MNLKLLIISFFFFFGTFSISLPLRINTKTGQYIDDQGRERFFHGINVVVKRFPWVPDTTSFNPTNSFSEKDMENLEDWGFNIIRLGTEWAGAEPTRGNYNMTYLNIIREIVVKSKSHNIYTLLDFHQDVLAEAFCGEGIPRWAVKIPEGTYKFPFPLQYSPFKVDSEGIPLKSECDKLSWPKLHFTLASSHAYQSFYNNVDGIADAFSNFWQTVAKMFKDEDSVIGYELINEPWAGDVIVNPLLLVPSVADRYNLEPFYDKIQKKLREVDDQHIIFYESVTFDDFFPVGFSKNPGGENYRNRSSLSYHYYSDVNFNINWQFWARNKDVKRLGGAGMVTEFGIGLGEKSNVEFFNICDNYLQSWIGWSYKPFANITGDCGYDFYDKNGTINLDLIKVVSRSYPQAVAGETKKIFFDHSTKKMELDYISCNCGETEIYFNQKLHYSEGFEIEISPAGVNWRIIKKNIIGIRADRELEGKNINVILRKK